MEACPGPPRRPRDPPGTPRESPRTSQGRPGPPRDPQGHPRDPQGTSRAPQSAPKTPPEDPQTPSKAASRSVFQGAPANPPTLSGVLERSWGKVYLPPYPPSTGPQRCELSNSSKKLDWQSPDPQKPRTGGWGVPLLGVLEKNSVQLIEITQ